MEALGRGLCPCHSLPWHFSPATVSSKKQSPELGLSSGCLAAAPHINLPLLFWRAWLLPFLSCHHWTRFEALLCKDMCGERIPFTIWHVRSDKNKPKCLWCVGVKRSREMGGNGCREAPRLTCWLSAEPAAGAARGGGARARGA